MTNDYRLATVLGLAHGVSDGSAGLLVGMLASGGDAVQAGMGVLLYNTLAFGGQPLAGLVIDRLGHPRRALLLGLGLNAAGLLMLPWGGQGPVLMAGAALAGAGSALQHTGGGALAYFATPARASGPGLFAAPGVLGLAIGGMLASLGYTNIWPWLLALLLCGLLLAALRLPDIPYTRQKGAAAPAFDAHDALMLLLLLAIALRSSVWSLSQQLLIEQAPTVLNFALAAALSKALGGFAADRFGLWRWSAGALLISAGLLILPALLPYLPLGRNAALPVLGLGLSLLQSTTPAMAVLMLHAVPRFPATAAGLVYGLPVIAGGVFVFTLPNRTLGATMLSVFAALAGVIVWAGLKWMPIKTEV